MSIVVPEDSFFKELKVLASLAWPLLIAQVTQTLMGVSDTIMAGRYNSIDMAAVAIGFGMSLPVLIFMQGITLGLSPIISRFDGAKNTDDVANAVHQMFYISLGISVPVLMLLFAIPSAVGAIEMSSELSLKTGDYLFYVLLSAPAFGIYQTLRNYCEGLSIVLPTMMIMGVGLLVNIPVNYIFINGLFGMPEMGGAGCGFATMLVFYTMAIATFVYTFYAPKLQKYNVYEQLIPLSIPCIKNLLTLGLPIAFTLVFEVTLFAVAAVLLAPLGASVVAAHQVALNVSSLIFMLPLSVGLALAIRIGFLIGEGRNHHTKKAYWAGMLLALSTVLITASSILLFNDQIARIYSNEEAVITAAAGLLIYAALFQFSDAIQVVSANALRGYKDTKAMFIISFISFWLVGFPVSVILGLSDLVVPRLAASGFWIGFITGLSVAAVLLFLRVKLIQERILNNA
jgi:MATE family multidrug resistance protein